MKLCLIMIGRFLKRNGKYYGDQKNINAINRYLKHFNEIKIVAREMNKSPLYNLKEVELYDGRISFNLVKDISGLLDYPMFMSKWIKAIRERAKESDVLLCWLGIDVPIVSHIAHSIKKPFIVYAGGCIKDSLLYSDSTLRKLIAMPIYLLVRNGVVKADYVHYVTQSELQKRYPTKGRFIGASYVMVDCTIGEQVIKNRISKYHKFENVCLGLVGYINSIKGIDTAIKALSQLDKRFVLRVLGGGDPSNYIKMAMEYGVGDRVFFDGTLPPGEQVWKWLDDIDIYIQPSRTEGLPRATIEAMSRGCPVISSNVMGLLELVEPKWRHKRGDWKALSEAIVNLASDGEELERQAYRSIQVSQRFDRAVLDDQINDFFNRITQKKN